MYRISTLLIATCLAGAATAQTTTVPADLNDLGGFPFTDISAFITADTADNGDQNNDVYLLEAGGNYWFGSQVEWDFDVTLRGIPSETLPRPRIDRYNAAGGTELDPLYQGFGSFTWDGLNIVMGDEGPTAAAFETTPFQPRGENKRFVFNNCIIEKSRQGTMRIEGANNTAVLTNNEIRNFGDYGLLQGNGRLVDPRGQFMDSVIIRGNYVYNILDRLYIGLRSPGGKYFDFSNNTVFNHVGRHGLIQLGSMKESHINDNVFYNTQILGTSPRLADEQITYENEEIYMFTIDTLAEGASAEMRNNNVTWSDEVLNLYATFDSISKPNTISPELATLVGDTTGSILRTPVELGAIPSVDPLVEYVREAVDADTTRTIPSIIVEDSAFVAGDDRYAGRYNFNFARFNPCYAAGAPQATAGIDGGPIGATFLCTDIGTATSDRIYNPEIQLAATPNPANSSAELTFRTTEAGKVALNVFDVRGQLLANVFSGKLGAGAHSFRYDGVAQLSTGMYFVVVKTDNGQMYRRLVVQH